MKSKTQPRRDVLAKRAHAGSPDDVLTPQWGFFTPFLCPCPYLARYGGSESRVEKRSRVMNSAQPWKDARPTRSYTFEMVLLTGLFVIPAAFHFLAVFLA